MTTGRRRMDPDVRRRVMASIKKKDTAPELALRRALWSIGVRGWRCHTSLPGTPDLAFTRWRLAVMVDGVWWHGHPEHLPTERHSAYWHKKIARNVERDKEVDARLTAMGWTVLRLWDLDILADPAGAIRTTVCELRRLGWPDEHMQPTGARDPAEPGAAQT